ncbi:MAG: imidazolonepropionase [Chloroflexota bacterium]|nr:imidazolonepropionase [Chloroflexota bacterium]
MLIHSAAQLLALSEQPQRGSRMGELSIIPDGAVLIEGETIAAVGDSTTLLSRYPNEERYDASGHAVLPGFVDPHTHLVWASDRAEEFEMRLEGKTYMEIMTAGGGIQSTVNATRAASNEELTAQTRQRAQDIFALGTTTAEAKSGYGLEWHSELKQMEVLLELDRQGPLEIQPTFLAAHAIPSGFGDRPDAYVQQICAQMLPDLKSWWAQHAADRPLPFVDVFCETGAFSLEQTRLIFHTAQELGFPLKVHADEFENLGGARLAMEQGAVSADHLVKTSPEEVRAFGNSDTVAVSLPLTPFGLNEPEYTPAKEIIAAGGLLALASDLNPGTAWCGNMQFVIALACRAMHLTPAQAIAAATINAAAAIRREAQLGSLHAGKQADLLVLKVDDYRHLAYRFGGNLVQDIFKKGRLYPKPC